MDLHQINNFGIYVLKKWCPYCEIPINFDSINKSTIKIKYNEQNSKCTINQSVHMVIMGFFMEKYSKTSIT